MKSQLQHLFKHKSALFFLLISLLLFAYMGYHQEELGQKKTALVLGYKTQNQKEAEALWSSTPIWIKKNPLTENLKIKQKYQVVLCHQPSYQENNSTHIPCLVMKIEPIKIQLHNFLETNTNENSQNLDLIWIKTPFNPQKNWLPELWQKHKIFSLVWATPILKTEKGRNVQGNHPQLKMLKF